MIQDRRPRTDRFPAAPATTAGGLDHVRVTVVMSTLDQVAELPHVFARLPDGLHEVIVVDLRSSDDTVAVARMLRPDVRIVEYENRDREGALARGRAAASGNIVVTVDADGSTDPAELLHFAMALAGSAAGRAG
jgi:glycosyltransferase involved in cell wall biosynthesis